MMWVTVILLMIQNDDSQFSGSWSKNRYNESYIIDLSNNFPLFRSTYELQQTQYIFLWNTLN